MHVYIFANTHIQVPEIDKEIREIHSPLSKKQLDM